MNKLAAIICTSLVGMAAIVGTSYLVLTRGSSKVDLGSDLKKVFAKAQELCKRTPEVEDNKFKIYAFHGCKYTDEHDVILNHSSINGLKKGNILVNDGDSIGGIYDAISKNKLDSGKIAVVNFANYYLCGGGVKEGCCAQEEDLFRRTNASKMWDNKKLMWRYYGENRKNGNEIGPIGENRALFNEDLVYFISGGFRQYYELPEKQWKTIDMITVAAPDKRCVTCEDEVMKERIRLIFEVAKENGVDTLGFGAFGCGVYRWEPKDVARMCKELLVDEGYSKYFNNIIFNIPDQESKNFKEFDKAFSDYTLGKGQSKG